MTNNNDLHRNAVVSVSNSASHVGIPDVNTKPLVTHAHALNAINRRQFLPCLCFHLREIQRLVALTEL